MSHSDISVKYEARPNFNSWGVVAYEDQEKEQAEKRQIQGS